MNFKGLKLVLAAVILNNFLFLASRADYTSVKNGFFEERAQGQSLFEIMADVKVNGKIQIIPSQSGNIKVSYAVRAVANSESEAKRFLDLVDIKLDVNRREKIVLEVLAPTHVPWAGTDYSVNLELLLEIPEKINIGGECSFMSMEIAGPFQDVNLNCGNSYIYLSKIYGSIRVTTSNRDVKLKSIMGDVRVETSNGKIIAEEMEMASGYAFLETTNGEITLDGIQGSVEAYTTYSPITAKDIDASEGSIVLRTNYAPINVANVQGELLCETSYYPVIVVNSAVNHGHSKIETNFAAIKAEFGSLENCEIYISSEYSDIELKLPREISGKLIASVDRGGRIHTKGIGIRPILLEPTRLEGLLGEGDARIELKVNGVGNIDILGP